MGNTPNTAAIYVRRSAFDAEAKAEAFSRSLAAQERECLFLRVFLYPQVTGPGQGGPRLGQRDWHPWPGSCGRSASR